MFLANGDVAFALAHHLEPRELKMLSTTCKAAHAAVTDPVKRVCVDVAVDLYTKRVHCVSDGVLTAYTKLGTRRVRIDLNYVDNHSMLFVVPVQYNRNVYRVYDLERPFLDADGQPTDMSIDHLYGMVIDGTALGVWIRDDAMIGQDLHFTLVVERELGSLSLSLVSD